MRYLPLAIILLLVASGCEKLWDKHFEVNEDTVDQPMWDYIRSQDKYSVFVSYMEEYQLDTIFDGNASLTLFVPDNEAFESFNPDTGDVSIMLQYHILKYLFSIYNVTEEKLLQTSSGKFSQAEFYNGEYRYSGVRISWFSPLFLDGRIYEIEEVAYPLPNLYEYIAQTCQVLKDYIDSYDSVLLDYGQSKPLGFNDEGQVVYDSVYSIVNYFDSLYFPVNSEDRYTTATFVLFSDEEYYSALEEMADNMAGDLTVSDIPMVWQEEVFIPELLSTGLFPNTLEYEDLMKGKLKNVQGDSAVVDYTNIDPDSRLLCSNGAAYNYTSFKVPEYLYQGEVRIEGESMVDSLGSGLYYWKPQFKVSGESEAVATNPVKSYSQGAENDSLMILTFPSQPFEGEFKLEFSFKNMLPQRYQLVWAANYRPSGVYNIYANDELIKEKFDMFGLRKTVYGELGDFYLPDEQGNNKLDAVLDNITEFGDIKITIEYDGRGGTTSVVPVNGINIDYIALIPIE